MANQSNSPQTKRRRRHHKTGPGPLSLAWAGLAFGLLTLITWLMLAPTQEDDAGLILSLDNHPEKFAPVDWANRGTTEQSSPEEPVDQTPRVTVAVTPETSKPSTIIKETENQTSGALEGVTEETLPSGARRIILPKADPSISPNVSSDPIQQAEESNDNSVVIKIDGQDTQPSNGKERRILDSKIQSLPPGSLSKDFRGVGIYGPTPRIAPDGRLPARHFARTFVNPEEKPQIAIMVAGLGLDPALTQAAISLPPEVSLAFAPYAKNLPSLAADARAHGHELLIEIPMESAGADEAQLGPAALMNYRSQEENRKRLDWILSRFEGFYGATNYLGGTFSANQSYMTTLLFALQGSGLAYIDDTGLARGPAQSMAMIYATSNFLLTPQSTDFNGMLAQIEARARDKGRVMVKIYGTPQSLQQLQIWIDKLPAKDIVLAPTSALVNNL